MSDAKTIEETEKQKDEDKYEVSWAGSGTYNDSFDVEATEFGIEVNGCPIPWAWILRQLAKRADKCLSF